tara:strand:+ start:370 stop:1263 length:894 start_codon:yes stop_codon:yes gene_type:complete
MKSIILAGGTGTRLGNLTKAVNKQLLPVGNQPAISHSVDLALTLCNDVLIVSDSSTISPIAKLEDTWGLGCYPRATKNVYYAVQRKPNGIPAAIALGECYANRGPVMVLLGDNVFDYKNRKEISLGAASRHQQRGGAHIWVASHISKRQLDLGMTTKLNISNYGALFTEIPTKLGEAYSLCETTPVKVIEKPTPEILHECESQSQSCQGAITGIYYFDSTVWDKLDLLHRIPKGFDASKGEFGEFQLAALLNMYIDEQRLTYTHIQATGWHDIGESVEGYWQVTNKMLADCRPWDAQ